MDEKLDKWRLSSEPSSLLGMTYEGKGERLGVEGGSSLRGRGGGRI